MINRASSKRKTKEPAHSFSQMLPAVFAKVHRNFLMRDRVRESMLRTCREIIRLSAESIRCIHRREWERAEKTLSQIQRLAQKLADLRQEDPELYFSGPVHDSQKEWVEASFLFAFLKRHPSPTPQSLQVEDAAFLKGVGEAVGELRRYTLDRLRENGMIEEEVLQTMDAIHFEIMKFDFPDALTLGLRRVSDQTRHLIERTRGDLTLAKTLRKNHLP